MQVEGLREQLDIGVLLTSVDELRGLIGVLERVEEQLSETAGVVRGWLTARDQQAGDRTALFWFAGWTAKARRVAAKLGLELVAVDWRQLEHRHRLDVQMDLLQIAQSAILGTGGSEEDRQGSSGHGGALGCSAMYHSSKEQCEQQSAEGLCDRGDDGSVLQLQTDEGQVQEATAFSRDAKRRRLQGSKQAAAGYIVGNAGQWAVRSTGAARWADAEEKAIAAEGTLAGEGGLYCRLWSEWERKQGMKWQKLTSLWVMRADVRRMQLGDSLKCGGKCNCKYRKGNSTKQVGQVEAMTEVMQKTGMN